MDEFQFLIQALVDTSKIPSEIERIKSLASNEKLKFVADLDTKNLTKLASDLANVFKAQKINIDESAILSTLNKIKSEAKVAGQQINKALNDSLKVSLDKTIDMQVTQLMKKYSVSGKNAFNEIKQAVIEYRKEVENANNATIDPNDMLSIFASSADINKVTEALSNNIKVANDAKNVYKDLYEYVKDTNNSGSKIHIPKSIASEYGDDYSSIRSSLGKAFTTGPGLDFEAWLGELNGQLGNIIDTSHGAEAAFGDLFAKLRMAKESNYLSGKELFDTGFLDKKEIESDITSAIDAIEAKEKELANSSNAAAITIVQNEEKKQQAYQNTEKAYRSFSELKIGNDKIDAVLDDKGLIDQEKTVERIRQIYSEFGRVKVTNQIDANGLKAFRVNIEQVNGELKDTRSFLMQLDSDGKSFTFADGIIKGSQSIVHHLDEAKNASSKVLSEEEKLANMMADVREKSEQARQAEQKRQEIAQSNAINKALEQEYQANQKLAQSVSDQQAKLDVLKSKWQEQGILVGDFKQKVTEVESAFSSVSDQGGLDNIKQKMAELSSEADKLAKIETGGFDTKLKSINDKMTSLGTTSTQLQGNVQKLNEAFNTMSSKDVSVEDRIRAYETFNSLLPTVTGQLKDEALAQKESAKATQEAAKAQQTLSKSQTLSNKMQVWLNENTKAAERYGEEIKDLQNQLSTNVDDKFTQNATLRFRQIQSEAKAAGLVTNTFATSLKNAVLQFAGLSSGYMVFQKVRQIISEGVSFTVELNDALTNINYTMDVTDAQLNKIGKSSINMAKELSSSTENVLQAVTLYANAKETADSILEKSKPAIMLSNVTGFSGEESAKYLQTIMNQFDLTQDDLMGISDTIQAVSQNIAHDFSKIIAA